MPEDLLNNNMDHIFDVTEDRKVTQTAYSGFITRVVRKHKRPMRTTFEIMLYCKIIMKEI